MKMLICSDGSPQSERALRLGSEIAVSCNAEVTLLGILETTASETVLESLKRGQGALLNRKIQAELIAKGGDPVEEIVKRTEETYYDLVVIGAVRKGARRRFWVSSKAYKIAKKIKPPVLLVTDGSTALKKMLLCTGGRFYVESAVRLTGTIARGVGATLALLHVMPEPPAIYAHLSRMEASASRLLDSRSELGITLRREKETLETMGVPVEVRLRRGAVIEGILREIDEGSYDLVVAGSALSRGLRTYVLGDVTREIVNRAKCAVLITRVQRASREPQASVAGQSPAGQQSPDQEGPRTPE